MKRLIPLLALFLFSCATTATNTAGIADDGYEEYIRAQATKFEEAFNAGKGDDLVAFYTDDAVVLAPHADRATGASGVRSTFTPLFGAKANMDLTTDKVVRSCDLAYEYGTYTMSWDGPSGRMNDRGKYVTIWRRMPNGEWRIEVDTFNTSVPPPGM
ncbi:MAG TPA: DUF4440 domain-containing protein [Thermoanaerobaculia bacterium]|nr:DUF4440 domain-containing protein [Thermoanaerobaculia bacterium]